MLTRTPLDITPFGSLLSALGIAYWLLAIGLMALALWLPKRWSIKLSLAAMVLGAFAYPVSRHADTQQQKRSVSQAQLAVAMAIFDERCKSAGEKVVRTVENVDGVLLTNIRKRPAISP